MSVFFICESTFTCAYANARSNATLAGQHRRHAHCFFIMDATSWPASCVSIYQKGGGTMPRTIRSAIINAPVDKVFAYIDDPTNAPEWNPSLIEVTEVAGSGVGQRFRWRYKMAGVPLNGQTTVSEHIPNERRVIQSRGGVEANWIFTFEPHDGGTMFGIDIEYTVPVPVLGKLAEKLVLKRNEREADMAIENIKDKMEG